MKPTKLTVAAVFAVLLFPALQSCTSEGEEEAPSAPKSVEEESADAPTPNASQSTPTGRPWMQQWSATCPMLVEDAQVEVADTEHGVALTFTTEGGSVSELRDRVRALAQMYEHHRGRGHMAWHHMGRRRGPGWRHGGMGRGHMAGRGPMPAAITTVAEIDRGARITLTPIDPNELELLREHVGWHQQRMQTGECWRLQNRSTAPPR